MPRPRSKYEMLAALEENARLAESFLKHFAPQGVHKDGNQFHPEGAFDPWWAKELNLKLENLSRIERSTTRQDVRKKVDSGLRQPEDIKKRAAIVVIQTGQIWTVLPYKAARALMRDTAPGKVDARARTVNKQWRSFTKGELDVLPLKERLIAQEEHRVMDKLPVRTSKMVASQVALIKAIPGIIARSLEAAKEEQAKLAAKVAKDPKVVPISSARRTKVDWHGLVLADIKQMTVSDEYVDILTKRGKQIVLDPPTPEEFQAAKALETRYIEYWAEHRKRHG